MYTNQELTPALLERFTEFFQKVDRAAPPLKRPHKTFDRIIRSAVPDPELAEIMGSLLKQEVSVLKKDSYIFILSAETGTVLEIFLLYELPDEAQTLLAAKRRVASRDVFVQRRKENDIMGWKWHTPLYGISPLDLTKLRFTKHALASITRIFPTHALSKPEEAGRMIFSHTTEEDLGVEAVKRLITHKFQKVRYFRFGRCRFVVTTIKDIFLVITVEVHSKRK